MNEYVDKPCVEILDSIKNIFPKHRWEEFKEDVGYELIALSYFKSILFKISKEVEGDDQLFVLTVRILYKTSENMVHTSSAVPSFITSNRALYGKKHTFQPFLLKLILLLVYFVSLCLAKQEEIDLCYRNEKN